MIAFFIAVFPYFAIAVTPSQVRETVIKNFPLIEEARLKREAFDGEVMSAKGEFDHKLKFKSRNRIEDKYDNQYFEATVERNTGVQGISLIAGHRQGTGVFPFYDGKYATSALGEIYAGISVPLLRDRSTDAARTGLAVARIERDQSKEELRMKEFIYIHKALSLYYKWIAEDRILKINRELLELAQQRETMLEKKFSRGDVEKVKVTDNQRTIAKRVAEVQKSEAKLRNIEAGLVLFIPGQTITVADESSTVSDVRKPQLSALNRDTLPQLRILNLEREKGKLLEQLAEQGRLPGLSVDVIGARELSPNIPYDPDRVQLGLRFDFPIENRKARGKTVAQSYKLRAIEKRIEYTGQELEANFVAATETLALNLDRFQTTSQEVEKSRVMASAEQTRFKMGGSELFTVLLRELDVADAEIRKWTAWYDYQQAVLDAKLFSGTI